MFKLNIDENRPYHYLISVGIKPMVCKDRGKIFLKHGPLKFTNDDIKNTQNASMISQDKLYKTTTREAVKMFDCEELVSSVWAIQIAAAANQCTLHHFSSDFEIPDDFWPGFVNRSNDNEEERKKIIESRIRRNSFF